MKLANYKLKSYAVALVLALTATMLISCLPIVTAPYTDDWFVFPRDTTAYMFLSPNPIGVNQLGVVQAWIVPRPLYPETYFYNYNFIITAPDGTTATVLIPETEQTGSVWFNYVYNQVGTWTVKFTWDGNDLPGGGISGDHAYTESALLTLDVQLDPILSWPPAPLPTDELTWPINPENREWYQISGAWPMSEYNSSGASYNPYSLAPETAHILWELPPFQGTAGLIGGVYGTGEYFSQDRGAQLAVNVVIAGKAYIEDWFNRKYICIDIRTGEELFSWDGPPTMGRRGPRTVAMVEETSTGYYPDSGSHSGPQIWSVGERLIKYDATNGKELLNVEGYGSSPNAMIGTLAYVTTGGVDEDAGRIPIGRAICWDTAGNAEDFADRLVFNTSFPLKGEGWVWNAWGDTVVGVVSDFPMESGAFDANTGEVLWIHNLTDIELDQAFGCGYGYAYYPINDLRMIAQNLRTGERDWYSEPMTYPWSNFGAYTHCSAFGMIYQSKYSGVWAWDALTGETMWQYSGGDSMLTGETPYGTWPFYHGPIAADDKVYASTGEWGEFGTIVYRGQNLHCIDAYEGTQIWSIMGIWNPTAIAEGTLFAWSGYDGNSYAFSKGPTLTEVSMLQNVIAAGESAFITGRVTDQSPAQQGTPCISSEYMSAWMEYLHMQQPMPLDATGVPVHLFAESDGTTYDIGSVTTTCEGYFDYKWTPPGEGAYQIYGTFDGDESYYSSYNITSLGVGKAVSPEQPIEPEEPAVGLITTEIAIIVAVAIAVVVGVVAYWALRKRK